MNGNKTKNNNLLINLYQHLVFLELEKLKEKRYDFTSSFLQRDEIKGVVDDNIFHELLQRSLLIKYDDDKFRTAHVELIWRVINLRPYPDSPNRRVFEFAITYDREIVSSFDDHDLLELLKIDRLSKDKKKELKIIIEALKDIYPSLSHFQFEALKKLLDSHMSKHIGIIAPTASGKTLIFTLPILIKAIELAMNGQDELVAILIYPRKALAKDQIEKWLELLNKLNKVIKKYGGKKFITIGLDYGDIDRKPPKQSKPLLNIKCPEPGCNGTLYISEKGEIYCDKANHSFPYIYAYKEKVWECKPHIYVTNIWTLYHRLMSCKTIDLIKEAKYVVLDEAHVYKGHLGSHVYYIINVLKKLLNKNNAIFIYSSATIPYPEDFLNKLSGEKNICIINYNDIIKDYYKKLNKEPLYRLVIRVYLLPPPNQSVETLTEESILTVALWCHRYNLKAITFIDSIAEISTIINYISETILGKRGGREILDHIKVENIWDDYSWRSIIPLDIENFSENRIKEWLVKDFKESINVHYSILSKEQRADIEEKFKSGVYKMLLATSTLELGIDIGDCGVIIQHKLPRDPAEFIQRIGRAGRSNDCYRISLSFINLQNSPIATLYFYDERLRSRLEKMERLEPLRIGLSSENILSQHLLFLLLHKLSLNKKINLTLDQFELYELIKIFNELDKLVDNLDEYVNEVGFKNDFNTHIYESAKRKVKHFIKEGRMILNELVRTEDSEIKSIRKLYEKVREICNDLRQRIDYIKSITKKIKNKIFDEKFKSYLLDNGSSKVINVIMEIINKAEKHANLMKRLEEMLNKVYKDKSCSDLDKLDDLVNELESHENEVIKQIDKFDLKVKDLLVKSPPRFIRTLAKDLKTLKKALIFEYIYDIHELLEELRKINKKEVQLLSSISYLDMLRNVLELYEYKKFRIVEFIEKLSQIIGTFKFSPMLEYPSEKILMEVK